LELKLVDGNYLPFKNGGLQSVRGIDETAQRIVMKLSAKRGQFLPMPEFGSLLHTLPLYKPSLQKVAAIGFVKECLADEPDIVIRDLDLLPLQDHISISLSITLNNRNINITTTI